MARHGRGPQLHHSRRRGVGLPPTFGGGGRGGEHHGRAFAAAEGQPAAAPLDGAAPAIAWTGHRGGGGDRCRAPSGGKVGFVPLLDRATTAKQGTAAASLEVTRCGTADHLWVGHGRASLGSTEWRHCLTLACWVQEPGGDPTTGGRTGDKTTLWVQTKIQLFRRQQEDNNYSGGVGHSDVW